MLYVSIVIANQKLSTRCVLFLFLCVSAQVAISCIRSNRSAITESLCDVSMRCLYAMSLCDVSMRCLYAMSLCDVSMRCLYAMSLCDNYAQGNFSRASQCQLVAVAWDTNFWYR